MERRSPPPGSDSLVPEEEEVKSFSKNMGTFSLVTAAAAAAARRYCACFLLCTPFTHQTSELARFDLTI